MTAAFKRDQNQRLKFTVPPTPHPPPPLSSPASPHSLGSTVSDEDASDTVRGFKVQIPAGEAERLRDKAWWQVREGWRAGQWSWAGGPMHTELRAAMIWGWREDKKKGGGAELITHISIGLPLRWPLHTSADTPGIRMNLEFSAHRAGQGWTGLPWRLQYRIQSHACHFLS